MHLWRIQQASSAYCSGVEIPVEMFSNNFKKVIVDIW